MPRKTIPGVLGVLATTIGLAGSGAGPAAARVDPDDCARQRGSAALGDLLDDLNALARVAVPDATHVAIQRQPARRTPPEWTSFLRGPGEAEAPPADPNTLPAAGDDACTVERTLRREADRRELPHELVLAVGWRESSWAHWANADESRVKVSPTGDYGLMQINKDSFERYYSDSYDWQRVVSDPVYNARVGGDILAWCYNYARDKLQSRPPPGQSDPTATDVYRSTYACYNGGPGKWRRPWRADSPYAHHDQKFERELGIIQRLVRAHRRICERLRVAMLR